MDRDVKWVMVYGVEAVEMHCFGAFAFYIPMLFKQRRHDDVDFKPSIFR